MKKITKIAAVFAASVMTICSAISYNGQSSIMAETTKSSVVDKYSLSDITTSKLVANMGIGWNLGNTLEACGDWINGKTVKDYETAWGSPVVTKAMIDGIHDAGFNSIRIPVAWSNLMAADYTISPELLNRVEEVMNYALDDNMYVIMNIHYDSGWISGFSDPAKYNECMKKYKAIWTQVGQRFAKYGDHLIFESMNEECFDNLWNHYGSDTTGKDKAYGLLNSINQTFVDTIRGADGNNKKRHLLIAGYITDIQLTCDPLYKMPNDPEHRSAVSVHYYTPYTFTLMKKDESWGKARLTWGTDEDYAELDKYMAMMKTNFVDKGIPVIIGEYGVDVKGNTIHQDGKEMTHETARLYLTSVCKEAYKFGMCPMLWDAMSHYDRNACKFDDPELPKALKNIVDTVPREGQVIYGDLNNDKSVNTLDYALIKRYILNINTNIDLKAADLNGDGIINTLDSVLLKRYILNQITKFPVEK